MDKIVKQYLDRKSQEIVEDYEMWFELFHIESPVEQILYIELTSETESYNRSSSMDLFQFDVLPQYPIKTSSGKTYKVDFLIYYTPDYAWQNYEEGLPEHHKDHALIVEVDSYLWHGTTPEQFEQEKKRERDLFNDGWKIMRFAAREVLRDPKKCAREVTKYFLSLPNIYKETQEMMEATVEILKRYRK